jgi:hypothetical protein
MFIPEFFTPEYNEYGDNDYHKQAKAQSQETASLPDDREFTMEEIRNKARITRMARRSWDY